jgi:hypothetical protein
MDEGAVYISNVRIERVRGPYRLAYLPAAENAIAFGVHDEIARHYGTDMSLHEAHPATLDYLVAATAG